MEPPGRAPAYLAPRTQHRQETSTCWPVPRVRAGELVLYGGYPGKLRAEHGRVAEFPFQWAAGGVSDVSEKNVVLEPAFETMRWLNSGDTNIDVRGMSGGPIFRIVEGILRLELVGFIHEFSDLADAVMGRPSDVVSANGRIVG
jgi:hypothetical protein